MADVKARDKSVDFTKGIAMIAVSFGHIMPVFYGTVDAVCKYFYSFELAAFFIASGYLQFGSVERKPLDHIKHNAVSLLYPYATFTVILLLIESLPTLLFHGIVYYIQGFPKRICSIITWGAGACWFFPTFFISGMVAYFCRRVSKAPNVVKTVALVVVGSIMCVIAEKYGYLKEVTEESITTASFWLWHLFSLISRSIVGTSLMMIGYELKHFDSDKVKKLSGGGYILSALLIVIGLVTCYFNYDFIDLHFAFIRNPVLFYISAISTTYALLIIGKSFYPACIVWCGRESLLLILAQSGMYYICVIITKIVDTADLPYFVTLSIAVTVLIVQLIISYFVIRIIRSTFLKILIVPPKKKEVK